MEEMRSAIFIIAYLGRAVLDALDLSRGFINSNFASQQG
jgi:hypothetical protein